MTSKEHHRGAFTPRRKKAIGLSNGVKGGERMTKDKAELVRLLPFLGQQTFEKALARQDIVQVETPEAIDMISSGDYELHPTQDFPPVGLLDHAQGLLTLKDRIGKPVSSWKLVEKVADALFQNGIRPRTLRGKELHWSYHSYLQPLGEVLTTNDFGGPNLFRGFQFLWNAQINRAPRPIHSAHLSDEECKKRGLWRDPIFASSRQAGNARIPYHQIGTDWLEYLDLMTKVLRNLRVLGQTCLEEGRILAVDHIDTGGGLIAPTRWHREQYAIENYHFVFSRDLPDQWFNESQGPRKKSDLGSLKQAIVFLEDEYKRLESDNQPMTKADFVKDLQQQFELSQNAANEAWKKANLPSWKKGGRPRRQA